MAQPVFNYSNISTSTGQLIKTGPGILAGFTINSLGSTASTIHVRDATSSGGGSAIATINVGTAVGTMVYDIVFSNGLHISNSSSTSDYTVEWA